MTCLLCSPGADATLQTPGSWLKALWIRFLPSALSLLSCIPHPSPVLDCGGLCLSGGPLPAFSVSPPLGISDFQEASFKPPSCQGRPGSSLAPAVQRLPCDRGCALWPMSLAWPHFLHQTPTVHLLWTADPGAVPSSPCHLAPSSAWHPHPRHSPSPALTHATPHLPPGDPTV